MRQVMKDDPLTISTVVLAIATLALAIGALWQLTISRRQLRAYMGVGAKDELSIIDPPGYIDVSIVLHNYGVSPAHQVYYYGKLSVFDYPLKGNEFKTPEMFNKEIYSPRIIYPGGEFSWMERKQLAPEEIDEIKRGTEKRLYLWGELRYRDVFRRRHFTKFAFMFGGPHCISAKKMEWAEQWNEAS
jgi:hypothetical protein